MKLILDNKIFTNTSDSIYSFNFNKNTSNFNIKGYFV